jgi:ATP-dependent 26S proteasome regulatory subunit
MKFTEELQIYLKSGQPFIWVTSFEPQRALEDIKQIVTTVKDASDQSLKTHIWRNTSGWDGDEDNSPKDIPERIGNFEDHSVSILENFHWYLGQPSPTERPQPTIVQEFIDSYYKWKGEQPRKVIFLCPKFDIAPELERLFVTVTHKLPSKNELGVTFDNLIKQHKDKITSPQKKDRDVIISAGSGMTQGEFETALAVSLLTNKGKITSTDIYQEKVKIFMRDDCLEPVTRKVEIEDVGGMSLLKEWLLKRKRAISSEGRDFGISGTRGVLFLGPSGCGKSEIAKAVGSLLELDVIRFNITKIYQPLLGESEEKLRKALANILAMAPIVPWFDEIEKGLGNQLTIGGGNIGMKIIGDLLYWMQEEIQDQTVFNVMTANSITGLPPELLRSGRSNGIWWIDYPTQAARTEILKIELRKRNHLNEEIEKDLESFAEDLVNYTGAEIMNIVEEGLIDALCNNQKSVTVDNLQIGKNATIPIYKTRAEEINQLREWALGSGRCRLAEKPDEEDNKRKGGINIFV